MASSISWLAKFCSHFADCSFSCQHSAPQCSLKFGKETAFNMALKLSDVEKKFWETPELVEKLLPFLDPESTLALAQCHKKIPRILEGPCMWNQFIRRACPFTDEKDGLPNVTQKNIDVVRCLVAILKLMKNSDEPRRALLELICERYPSKERGRCLHLACLSHPEGHRISFGGLLLLEEVESAFDSTVQRIEKLYSYGETRWDNSLWSALSARMLRYQETMTKVWIGEFEIADLRTMKAFRTLLQFCPAMGTYLEAITVDLDNLAMVQEFRNLLLFCPHPREDLDLIVSGGDIGNEGWAL